MKILKMDLDIWSNENNIKKSYIRFFFCFVKLVNYLMDLKMYFWMA